MKISWFIAHPLDLWQNYILNTYLFYNKKYGGIRFDVCNGERFHGNTIPPKKYRKILDRLFFFTSYQNTLYYIWKKHKPTDIVHLQHSYLFPRILNLLDQKERPKIIITLRGSDTYCWPWFISKWTDLYKTKSQFIDAFIVQSNDQKKYLNKFGVQNEKIWIIPVSSPKITCKPKTIIKIKTIRLISVFRFTWEKNILGNLLFIKRLKTKFPNIKYDIYGAGSPKDTAQIYYLIDRFDIKDIVKVNDNMPNDELKERLNNYNYYLQLSVSEAFGASIIEAQQRGLVPIVSNMGGIPEIVEDGETGIMRHFDDIDGLVNSLIGLHNDPKKYQQISNNCINLINDNYTTENEVEKLNSLYNNLMNRNCK